MKKFAGLLDLGTMSGKDFNESSNQSLVTENDNINKCLNDDCLIHIFQYLTNKEKVEIEGVCRRWNALSNLIWNNVTSLKVDELFVQENMQGSKTENTNFFIKLLKRCSKYLSILYVDGTIGEVDYLHALKKTVDCVNNITELGIKHLFDTENFLQLFFEKNKSLKSISLRNLEMNGSSLLSLNGNQIEILVIDSCEIENVQSLCDFFGDLKNLNVLDLDVYYEAIYALERANVKSLRELSVNEACYFVDPGTLNSIITKQKQLRKIHLDEFTKKLIRQLPLDNIEEIGTTLENKEILSSLHLFKNLKTFVCTLDEFTVNILRSISKCKSIKELNLEISYYDLRNQEENQFSIFESLETLKLNIMEEGCCKNLLGLSKCKKLKKLEYNRMQFIENCTKNIELFSSLEIIDIYGSNITNKILSEIVMKSPKLNYCRVRNCQNINNEFINLASAIKVKRNDSHILTIEHDYITNIKQNDLHELPPLICLKNKPFP